MAGPGAFPPAGIDRTELPGHCCRAASCGLALAILQALRQPIVWRPSARTADCAGHFQRLCLVLGTAALLELVSMGAQRAAPHVQAGPAHGRVSSRLRQQACELQTVMADSAVLLALYLVLVLVYALMATTDLLVLADARGRPLYTLRFLEWQVAVPLLMVLMRRQQRDAGGRALGRWASPAFLTTVLYIGCAWLALLMESERQRWLLIACSFLGYFVAAAEQLTWLALWDGTGPSGAGFGFAKGMLVAQVGLFGFYGLVYVLAALDRIDTYTEQLFYTTGDALTKIGHAGVFLAHRRRQESDALLAAHRETGEAEARAWRSAEDLGRLVDASGAPIFCTDNENRVTLWNAAATRLFGHASSEALGRPLDKLLPCDAPENGPRQRVQAPQQEVQARVEQLLRFTRDDASSVRAEAVLALGQLCRLDPKCVPLVLPALQRLIKDPMPLVRERSVHALRAAGAIAPRRSEQLLGVALRDADPSIRNQAAQLLRHLDEAK